MSKIEIGRYSERLRRALGMKGQEIVSGELSPEVSPVIVLEDNAAEWQFLQGVRLCTAAMRQNAVAAQNNLFHLRNPVDSGVLAVLTSLSMSSNVGSTIFNMGLAISAADLATPGATALRDSRWGVAANPTTLIASRANNVAISLANSFWVSASIAGTPEAYPGGPILLLPGDTLEWGSTAVNLTMLTTANWTERQLPALES